MRKWKPDLKIVQRIIKDFNGNPVKVAEELGCQLEDLKKFEALWPNDRLKRFFATLKKLEDAERKKQLNKKPKTKRYDRKYPTKDELVKLFHKYKGDRAKIAEVTGYSREYLGQLTKKISYSYKDFCYYGIKETEDPLEYLGMPTNDQRLFYKDNPEIRYWRQAESREECLEKREEEI